MRTQSKSNSWTIIFVALASAGLTACSQGYKPMAAATVEQSSSSASPFKCVDPDQSSPSESYLLTKIQYTHTIEDLFGPAVLAAAANVMTAIAPDSYDPDTHQKLSSLSSNQIDAFHKSAQAIAAAVTGNSALLKTVFGACAAGAAPGPACIDGYLSPSGFSKKIFRRSLTSAEQAFAKRIMATAGSYTENLKALLTYHLISPAFLWRLELGTNLALGPKRAQLTAYEVATRLSYLITDSTPDDALLQAAESGLLDTSAGIGVEVRRLLRTPRGKSKLIDGLLYWSLNDSVTDLSALPVELTNGVQMAGIEQAMLDEARVFVDQTVYAGSGTFLDLMTSDKSYATHPGLAQIYGHAPVTSQPAVFGGRRQGILMRAPAYTSSLPRSNIIIRGVKFQKRILCNQIPNPTVDIVDSRTTVALTPAQLLTVSNRAAVTHQTSNAVCMSCHASINPAGYALESLDPLGRLRVKESVFDPASANSWVRDIPLDTSALVPTGGGGTLAAADAFDLISAAARSPAASSCVTRNLYRFAYEKSETAEDACQLDGFQSRITDPNQPVLSAVEALFSARGMLYKNME